MITFDDDDPPYFDDALESAARFAEEMVDKDPEDSRGGQQWGPLRLQEGSDPPHR